LLKNKFNIDMTIWQFFFICAVPINNHLLVMFCKKLIRKISSFTPICVKYIIIIIMICCKIGVFVVHYTYILFKRTWPIKTTNIVVSCSQTNIESEGWRTRAVCRRWYARWQSWDGLLPVLWSLSRRCGTRLTTHTPC